MFANGKLWGALDTAVNPDGGPSAPASRTTSSTRPRARSSTQGYLGAAGLRLHLPGDRRHGERARRHRVHGHGRRPRSRARPMRRSTRTSALARGTSSRRRRSRAGRRLHGLQVAGRHPAAHSLGRLRRRCGGRELDLDCQRIHRQRLRLHRLGRPVLRGRHAATTCWAPAPARATGPVAADSARQLVDADQQADAVAHRRDVCERRGPAVRPALVSGNISTMRFTIAVIGVVCLVGGAAQASTVKSGLYGKVTAARSHRSVSPSCRAVPRSGALIVFSRAGQVARTRTSTMGTYRVTLTRARTTFACSRRVRRPGERRVPQGHFRHLDFSIDTGIR